MPTLDLPERPNIDSFRRQARALQRAIRAGDPAATLGWPATILAGRPRTPAVCSSVLRNWSSPASTDSAAGPG